MDQNNDNRWLLKHRKDVTSQAGEDGILEKIFEILPVSGKPWCVEFGAWDGKHFSNTYNCIANKKWSGVLIEGDKVRFKDLLNTYGDNKQVVCVDQFVGFDGENSLDNILSKTSIPREFELLSIDVDGNDYHIWKSLVQYKPKVVIIEFNATIPANIEFVQPADKNTVQGNSILSMTNLAREKGYELVCINRDNALYVDQKYFSLMKIKDNSIDALKYYKEPLQVFQLYDGTLVFHGHQYIYFYGLPYDFNRLQILPKFIREGHFPWNKRVDLLRRVLFKLHKCVFKPLKKAEPPYNESFGWIKEKS